MANIKNMRMWESICTDARIGISKSLFGLRTTATYRPTNSVIDAYTLEYSPQDGERIRHLLDMSGEKRAAAIGDFHPRTVDYGNYLAEVCTSHDRAFLAVRLYQFHSLNYEAATDLLVFEGAEAETVARLFL